MKKVSLFVLIIFLIFSCNNSTVYSNYYSFENDIWHADSSIVFNFNSNNATSLKFDLSVSYNNEYPFQNFFTSYSLLDSNRNILNSKMIEFQFFEKKYGYPLGSGIFKDFVKDSLILEISPIQKNSEYIFLVKHSMREDKLKGINKLGLNISN